MVCICRSFVRLVAAQVRIDQLLLADATLDLISFLRLLILLRLGNRRKVLFPQFLVSLLV